MGTIALHQPTQGNVDGFVEVVGDVDKVWIEWADHAGIHHRAVEPVEQAPRGTHWTKMANMSTATKLVAAKSRRNRSFRLISRLAKAQNAVFGGLDI